MTPNPEHQLLRNCALCWPVAVGMAASWGWPHALAAGISGAVVVANLWVLALLSGKLVAGIAGDDPRTALWMAALFAKFALFAGILVWVGSALPLLGVAFGFLPLMLGTLATGIEIAVREPPDFDTTGEVPTDEA